MVFIFPLVPILIAVFLIFAALLNETAVVIDNIITVAWVIVIVLSAILIIYNFFRKTSVADKIWSSIISIAATILTMIESKTFLFGLAASSDTSSILGTVEFGFVLIFGGAIWLASAGMSIYATFVCVDPNEYDDFKYIKAIGLIVGSGVLAGIFGLLG